MQKALAKFTSDRRGIKLDTVVDQIIEYNKVSKYANQVSYDALVRLQFIQTELDRLVNFIRQEDSHSIPSSISVIYAREAEKLTTSQAYQEPHSIINECNYPVYEKVTKLSLHSLPLYING